MYKYKKHLSVTSNIKLENLTVKMQAQNILENTVHYCLYTITELFLESSQRADPVGRTSTGVRHPILEAGQTADDLNRRTIRRSKCDVTCAPTGVIPVHCDMK